MPAGFANMAPALFSKIKFLKYPIDCNLKFMGKPLLGKNKTLKGLIMGLFMAILIALIQTYLFKQGYFQSISLIDYNKINPLLFGFIIGLGAVVGDLVESFFKRRIGLKPGQPLYFFDQTDWIIGSIIFTLPYYVPSLLMICITLLLGFLLHIIIKNIGFFLKLEKVRW
jgi:CDP-2,3-bis-(O-geranylgeranyl)-sn-glycerol synthase